MGNIISFMHISLDGFVAGPNGEMDWIKVDEEIFDYVHARISESDTAMYGRATYEMMESYWPTAASKPAASRHDIQHSEWYSKAHKLVLSKTMKDEENKNREKAIEFLEIVGLTGKKDELAENLSYGQRKLVELARAMATEAELFLLDEPIAGVDPVARDKILDAIINNYNESSSMIITTHLVRDMESLFDEVVFLREGEILLKGNAEALREEKGKSIDEIYKEVFGE